MQQCILPENWSFFRSGTNDHRAQSLTHENAFLRLCVNDHNCNISCLETNFSRLVPLITQQQYMSLPETEPGTPSPWLILYQSYLGMYALGKGLMELLQPWGIILFIYSQQLAEKYRRPPLKLVRWVLSRPLLMSKSEASSVTSTLNKIYTKLWVTETDSGVKSSPLETTNPVAPFTASYR